MWGQVPHPRIKPRLPELESIVLPSGPPGKSPDRAVLRLHVSSEACTDRYTHTDTHTSRTVRRAVQTRGHAHTLPTTLATDTMVYKEVCDPDRVSKAPSDADTHTL